MHSQDFLLNTWINQAEHKEADLPPRLEGEVSVDLTSNKQKCNSIFANIFSRRLYRKNDTDRKHIDTAVMYKSS